MSKKIEFSTLLILISFAFFCALIVGNSWDEFFEMNMGKERLKYFFSLGSYKDYDFYNSRFYPGFYNSIAIFLTKMLPSKYEIEVWHLINCSFSIFTIFGISKIAGILFNKKIAKIVFFISFLNPIFFGHMSINPKDTIIAFAHVWTTYLFIKYLQTQRTSKFSSKYILLAGLTIGLGTGVRVPFIITLFPVFLFGLIDIFFTKKITNNSFSFSKFVFHLIFIFLISYFVTISFWPHVHNNIILQPFNLLIEQTKNYVFGVDWILFNGIIYSTDDLPDLYIFINFFYKSPEFILFSYLIFFFIIFNKKNFFNSKFNFFRTKLFFILIIFLFPAIFFIFLPYRVYDGLRLFLYTIPYFNIIPALAIYYLIKNFKLLVPKILSCISAVLFLYYLVIFVLLTPYHYTYLNIFAGNYAEAHKKFENDYWSISIKELIQKISYKSDLINNEKIYISFCGASHKSAILELNKIKKLNYEIKNLYDENIHYVIMTNRVVSDINNDSISNVESCFDKFDGKNIISVERNGLTLSTLRKLY